MRCDECGSSDSVFFINPDGSGGESRLCRACAVAKGYASRDPGLGARIDSMLSLDPASPGPACTACGWTTERARAGGQLGCAACVAPFRRELLSALKRAGASSPYEGKVPRGRSGARPGDESRAELSRSLEMAILAEDFEAAAAIRDRLRAAFGDGRH
jgi:protein arginine kinase activator